MEGKRLPVDPLIESRFAEFEYDVFLTSMEGETYQLLERQRNASSARVLALSDLERYKSLRLRHRTFRYVMEAAKVINSAFQKTSLWSASTTSRRLSESRRNLRPCSQPITEKGRLAGSSLLKEKGPLRSLPTKLVHSPVYDRRDSGIGSGNDMR
jgi:hypothetical protein